MKNLLTPLAKSVLVPLGLETASSTDGAIQKKYFNSGVTTLILSNEKLVDTMKTVKSRERAGLLAKGCLWQIQEYYEHIQG